MTDRSGEGGEVLPILEAALGEPVSLAPDEPVSLVPDVVSDAPSEGELVALRAELARTEADRSRAVLRALLYEAEMTELVDQLHGYRPMPPEQQHEQQARIAALEAQLEAIAAAQRLTDATAIATELGYRDPVDALALLGSLEAIDHDDDDQFRGRVTDRLAELARDKPYLLVPARAFAVMGSADAGTRDVPAGAPGGPEPGPAYVRLGRNFVARSDPFRTHR